MTRVVKKPHVRRAEILEIANQLFQTKGYESTSVEEIVQTVGVAKGTFYHYFKSKEEILAVLAQDMVITLAEHYQAIANDPQQNAIDKFRLILSEQYSEDITELNLVDDLHRPENRELHERNNIETIRVLGPILAEIVEQGQQEGVFQVENPLATIQFILAGSLFLFGHGIFNWTEEEELVRKQAMLQLIERSLGAKAGVFSLS